jgi:diguanylate cyclase (GGDEF)-like protein
MDGVLPLGRSAPSRLTALATIARERTEASVCRSLSAARELLGMDLAFVAETDGDTFRFEAVEGDATAFGELAAGVRIARRDTLCDRMLSGAIGNVIPDVAAVPAALSATASPGVGAYIGVPVRLPDGSVFGSLCCVSTHPTPTLHERDVRVLDVLARMIGDQIDRERHQRRTARLAGEAAAGQALLAALKARERYTAEHSEAVVGLATAVAARLGLCDDEIVEVAQVALLHDVGKLGVPEAVLQKPGPLDDAEWRIIRSHPATGERVVASIAALAHLAPAIRAEHERWDGMGYPDGLAGDDIPLASRICLACDALHAMTSDRPYRAALSASTAREELVAGAGTQFCPRTVAALLAVLDDPGGEGRPASEEVPAQPETELRALIAVASAVAAAHRLEDVLEVVAEQTRRVVGAASVSISRWEREQDRVRTLINVGELGPDEERFPRSEIYELADYPRAAQLLREGSSYVISSGDPGLPAGDRALLTALDKGSYIGVAVVFDGRTWGKLEAFANVGALPFTNRHVPFLEAIAGQVGAAIGRAELFSRVNALAYSDPLTGLGNRRSLDERLERVVAAGADVAIVFCDLDGLKEINDTHGHAQGDAAIRAAADALVVASAAARGASVFRVGGDEFCVVLEGGDAAAATAVALAAGRELAVGGEPLSLSCGVAERAPGARPADLLRAADSAQYVAKRHGGGRVVAFAEGMVTAVPGTGRRANRDGGDPGRLERAERLLEALAAARAGERAAILARALERV